MQSHISFSQVANVPLRRGVRCAQRLAAQGPDPLGAAAHHGTGVPHSWLCAEFLGVGHSSLRADEPTGARCWLDVSAIGVEVLPSVMPFVLHGRSRPAAGGYREQVTPTSGALGPVVGATLPWCTKPP